MSEGHVSEVTDFFEYFRVLNGEPTIPSLPGSRGDPIPAFGGTTSLRDSRFPQKWGNCRKPLSLDEGNEKVLEFSILYCYIIF